MNARPYWNSDSYLCSLSRLLIYWLIGRTLTQHNCSLESYQLCLFNSELHYWRRYRRREAPWLLENIVSLTLHGDDFEIELLDFVIHQ